MDKELIIWILTAVLGGVDIGTMISVAIVILKGIKKRLEDSTGIKRDVIQLNKNLSKVIEQNEQLKEENRSLMLEMKGIKSYGDKGIRVHREAKK